MKKLLLAVVSAGLMVSSALAFDGTVTAVIVKPDGSVKIGITSADGQTYLSKGLGTATADGKKAMLAAAMTAKASGSTVEAYDNGTDWTFFKIK